MKLKKVLGLFLTFTMIFSINSFVFADTIIEDNSSMAINNFSDDHIQSEIRNNLAIVSNFIFNEDNIISLEEFEEYTYEIPMNEEHIVTVTVRNEQVPAINPYGILIDTDLHYNIIAGQQYHFTLYASNLTSSGGSVTHEVYYTPNYNEDGSFYNIRVNDVYFSGIAPSGYKITECIDWIGNYNGLNIVDTYGYIIFDRTILSDIYLDSWVKISGMLGLYLQYDWVITW